MKPRTLFFCLAYEKLQKHTRPSSFLAICTSADMTSPFGEELWVVDAHGYGAAETSSFHFG